MITTPGNAGDTVELRAQAMAVRALSGALVEVEGDEPLPGTNPELLNIDLDRPGHQPESDVMCAFREFTGMLEKTMHEDPATFKTMLQHALNKLDELDQLRQS
jgi:hypothetical protein